MVPQKSDGAALLLVVVNSKLVVFKTKMIQDTILSSVRIKIPKAKRKL